MKGMVAWKEKKIFLVLYRSPNAQMISVFIYTQCNPNTAVRSSFRATNLDQALLIIFLFGNSKIRGGHNLEGFNQSLKLVFTMCYLVFGTILSDCTSK